MRVLIISGNVVSDAEVKTTKEGREFVTFRMVSHEFDKNAEDKRDTYWFRVTAPNISRSMVQYLTKGKGINVIGKYSDNLWTRENGSVDIQREILADNVFFADSVGAKPNGTSQTQATTQTPPQEMPRVSANASASESKASAATAAQEEDDLPF